MYELSLLILLVHSTECLETGGIPYVLITKPTLCHLANKSETQSEFILTPTCSSISIDTFKQTF